MLFSCFELQACDQQTATQFRLHKDERCTYTALYLDTDDFVCFSFRKNELLSPKKAVKVICMENVKQ
jgi:hypothetical protein